jgi:hypothetical protein
MLQNIILNIYIPPHLPPSLYRLAYPNQKLSSIPGIPSLQSSSASSIPHLTISDAASVQSGVSAVTMPTLITQATKQKGTHYANVAPDQSLIQLLPPGTKIRDLMGTDPPPVLDNGQQLCLSYLLRGGCWSTCKRAASHSHTLNAAEKDRLRTYLHNQKQKLTGHSPTAPSTQPTRVPALP